MTKARIGFAMIQVSLVGAICSVGAGIVAPDFSARGTGVEEARFLADLQTVRCQLELYKIQHNEQLPPTESYASFERALTAKGADNRGPYLQTMPTNPFNGDSTVRFENSQNTAGSGKAGWVVNTGTGVFQADDSAEHAAL
jgi:general secretion pathway protein G